MLRSRMRALAQTGTSDTGSLPAKHPAVDSVSTHGFGATAP